MDFPVAALDSVGIVKVLVLSACGSIVESVGRHPRSAAEVGFEPFLTLGMVMRVRCADWGAKSSRLCPT